MIGSIKQGRRSIRAGLLSAAMVVAVTAPAWAENAGGGWWDHGVNTGSVYSNYVHPVNVHCSSVQGTVYNFSGAKAAHVMANSSAPRVWVGTNYAWYNNNC